MHETVTHTIFDFNGTLVDSFQLFMNVVENILKSYGHSMSSEMRLKLSKSQSLNEMTQTIKEEIDLPIESEELGQLIVNEWKISLKDLTLMPGVEKLIKHLHECGIPMAIATNTEKDMFEKMTQNFPHFFTIGKYFHHFVLGDDPEVRNNKSLPDIYRICAQRFNPPPVNPKNVLVFEDSVMGVDGASTAGMQCCLVNDRNERNDNAIITINSLNFFDPKLFGISPFT